MSTQLNDDDAALGAFLRTHAASVPAASPALEERIVAAVRPRGRALPATVTFLLAAAAAVALLLPKPAARPTDDNDLDAFLSSNYQAYTGVAESEDEPQIVALVDDAP